MRTTRNVSITMPIAMVKDAERLARRENRTMSLAAYGARQAKKLGTKESDVVRLIHESRARRKA